MSTSTQPFIPLTPREHEIFEFLRAACQTVPQLKHTVVRVCGGWVRDKLLGRPSQDIDLAVNNLTGLAFATLLRENCPFGERSSRDGSLTKRKFPTRRKAKNLQLGTIRTTKSNPKLSKHLETATFRLHGMMIDVTNLRTETYASATSRIPEMKFGTAKQDAERRDFTINSLFYNLHTKEIEDLTGLGQKDLNAKLIRTPLASSQTFEDDPLRILRAARFAARLGFTVHKNLGEAASDPEVNKNLVQKVDKQRLGQELRKILDGDEKDGKEVKTAFTLLAEWGILSLLFSVPPSVKVLHGPLKLGQTATDGCEFDCKTAMKVFSELDISLLSPDSQHRRALVFAALLSPYFGVQCQGENKLPLSKLEKDKEKVKDKVKDKDKDKDKKTKKADDKEKWRWVLQWLLEGLGFAKADANLAGSYLHAAHTLRSVANWSVTSDKEKQVLAKVTAGHLLMSLKQGWTKAFLLAKSLAQVQTHGHEALLSLPDWLRRAGLNGCWKWEPLFTGDEVAQKYRLRGKAIAEFLRLAQDWRFLNPGGDAAGFEEYLHSERDPERDPKIDPEREPKEIQK